MNVYDSLIVGSKVGEASSPRLVYSLRYYGGSLSASQPPSPPPPTLQHTTARSKLLAVTI